MKKIFKEIEYSILEENDLSLALEMARVYGNMLWFADTGIYDSPHLEANLIDRGVDLISAESISTITTRAGVLHVVSEPLMSGGHTRLMERLAQMEKAPADLLISREATPQAEARVSSFFNEIRRIRSSRTIEKLVEITELLLHYKKIVLHIDPDDVIVVVACGIAKRFAQIEVYFVNHADHVFSYGSSVADYYFELSGYGKKLDANKTIRGRKSFLGIPVEINFEYRNLDFKPESDMALLFVSAGSDFKYKTRGGVNIFSLVSEILSVYPKSKFIIVGSDIKYSFWWWYLKIKYKSRLIFKPCLDIHEYMVFLKKADYYVDSHPFPGGTAFAEQFMSGRRCVGLISPIKGYSPAERLKKYNVNDVMASISDYKHSEEIFIAVRDVNSIESVTARYLGCLYSGLLSENPLAISAGSSEDPYFIESYRKLLCIDMNPKSYLFLLRHRPKLACRLFFLLSLPKKAKLLIKILLVRWRYD